MGEDCLSNETLASDEDAQESSKESSELNICVSQTRDLSSEDEGDEEGEAEQHQPEKRTPCKCIRRFTEQWPRTAGIVFGVFFPLWLLMAMSCLFGFGLATIEAPSEIDTNDAILDARFRLRTFGYVYSNLTISAPRFCWVMYVRNESIIDLGEKLDEYFAEPANVDVLMELFMDDNNTEISSTGDALLVNVMESAQFMKSCGEQMVPVVENFDRLFFPQEDGLRTATQDLTFNWNRCSTPSNETDRAKERLSSRDEGYHPESQEELYTASWRAQQSSLYTTYLDENLRENFNTKDLAYAKTRAYLYSIEAATGSSECEVNIISGAWFFFTVMTTIGYGNQAPSTTAGRAMIYVCGFLSILAFGFILANAGFVINSIVDDMLRRARLPWLSVPWLACLLWALIYYSWMVLIAQYTVAWKQSRLDEEDFSFWDGYWFAYISSTTVGLGDIFLEPEVFLIEDLFVFPLLFLVAFVFFSAFLGKFADLLKGLRRGGQVEEGSLLVPQKTLTDNLKETNVCWRCPRRQ